MFGNYSKLIAALVGNVVAIAVAYLGTTQLGTCTGEGEALVCTVLGFTAAQITGAVMMVVNSFFVWWFPPNKKPVTL